MNLTPVSSVVGIPISIALVRWTVRGVLSDVYDACCWILKNVYKCDDE